MVFKRRRKHSFRSFSEVRSTLETIEDTGGAFSKIEADALFSEGKGFWWLFL